MVRALAIRIRVLLFRVQGWVFSICGLLIGVWVSGIGASGIKVWDLVLMFRVRRF